MSAFRAFFLRQKGDKEREKHEQMGIKQLRY